MSVLGRDNPENIIGNSGPYRLEIVHNACRTMGKSCTKTGLFPLATLLTVDADARTHDQHMVLPNAPHQKRSMSIHGQHPSQRDAKVQNRHNEPLDGILLSMTKIPHDDILEGLYKLRIRESEKLKTVLELYDLETHQKKLEPDFHGLKTMVKRSIEQEIRNKNFGIRSGNFEKNAVVKNQGTKQRVRRILGDCWQWETNGQCVKGDNCSFRHDTNKRGKVTPSNPSPNSFMQQSERKSSRTRSPRGRSPSGRTSRWPCKDYLRGTCNDSFCEKRHPPECLFYKTKSGCRFGEKCSFAHRQVDEQCEWNVLRALRT